MESPKLQKTKLKNKYEEFTPNKLANFNNQVNSSNDSFNNIISEATFRPFGQIFNSIAGFGNEIVNVENTPPYSFTNNLPRQPNYSNLKTIRRKFEPLKDINFYGTFDSEEMVKKSHFFIIHITSTDDIHKSMKYGYWTGTLAVNKTLSGLWKNQDENKDGNIFLIFRSSVQNVTYGVAFLKSGYSYDKFPLWQDYKLSGTFAIKWVYVKNLDLDEINLQNNGKELSEVANGTKQDNDCAFKQLKQYRIYENTSSLFNLFRFLDIREDYLANERTKTGVSIESLIDKIDSHVDKRPKDRNYNKTNTQKDIVPDKQKKPYGKRRRSTYSDNVEYVPKKKGSFYEEPVNKKRAGSASRMRHKKGNNKRRYSQFDAKDLDRKNNTKKDKTNLTTEVKPYIAQDDLNAVREDTKRSDKKSRPPKGRSKAPNVDSQTLEDVKNRDKNRPRKYSKGNEGNDKYVARNDSNMRVKKQNNTYAETNKDYRSKKSLKEETAGEKKEIFEDDVIEKNKKKRADKKKKRETDQDMYVQKDENK